MAKKQESGWIWLLIALGLGFLVFEEKASGEPKTLNTAPNENLQTLTPTQFIDKYLPLAQQVSKQYGIPVATILGLSGFETGWGTNGGWRYANNAFSIEADASWHGATWKDFRKYDSIADSFADFGRFLKTNSRYQPAFDSGTTDPVEFGDLIATAGYGGSDPTYMEDLTPVIEQVQKILQAKGIAGRKMSKEAQVFISAKIEELINEGYEPKRAEAAAYSEARRRGFKV